MEKAQCYYIGINPKLTVYKIGSAPPVTQIIIIVDLKLISFYLKI